MQRLNPHSSWHRRAMATVACSLFMAASASAQVGTAVDSLNIGVGPGAAWIGFSGTGQADTATTVGGVTLFAASAPNGPLLARVPFLPPFHVDPDSSTPDPWNFFGVPPGTYYVALVYGIVAAPAISAADWTPLVVPGACTGAPGVGVLDRRSGGAEPNSVRFFMSSFGGCATSYLIEAGTTPGATNVAAFEQTGVFLGAGGVPPGNYYIRVRGRNQFGIGPYSPVLPISVPDCPSGWTELGSDLTATVVGNQVTLSWTPPTPAPQNGGPVTYYELARLNGLPSGSPPHHILLPVTTTSLSTTLPPGTYAVGLFGGNNCRSDAFASVLFTVP